MPRKPRKSCRTALRQSYHPERLSGSLATHRDARARRDARADSRDDLRRLCQRHGDMGERLERTFARRSKVLELEREHRPGERLYSGQDERSSANSRSRREMAG